jgi:fructokinase
MSRPGPIIYGEVLFDHFPDGSVVLGGAPFNVAWHLQAFGQSPLFISRIGNDALGRNIRTAMLTWGMDTAALQLDSQHPTGTVEVSFIKDEPSFDIVKNSAYDFIEAGILPPLNNHNLIYHGSLILRGEISRTTLQKLKQGAGLPGFVDINLRAPWWTESSIDQALQGARWLKLNNHELALVMPGAHDDAARINYLLQNYDLQYLVVTQGSAGATAVSSAGEKYHVDTGGVRAEVVDTVGAGDAFSSVLLLGQLRGWQLRQSLERAQAFARAIVSVRGATIKDKEFYQPFINAWKLD